MSVVVYVDVRQKIDVFASLATLCVEYASHVTHSYIAFALSTSGLVNRARKTGAGFCNDIWFAIWHISPLLYQSQNQAAALLVVRVLGD